MGLAAFVQQLWLALVGSDNVRITGSQPIAGLVGATVTCGKAAYGAWAQLVAAAGITDPSWLVGIQADTFAKDADVASYDDNYNIEVGSGAVGFEVALGLLVTGWHHIKLTAVGEYAVNSPAIYLPRPIRIAGAPRLASRGATSAAGATEAVNVKAVLGTVLTG